MQRSVCSLLAPLPTWHLAWHRCWLAPLACDPPTLHTLEHATPCAHLAPLPRTLALQVLCAAEPAGLHLGPHLPCQPLVAHPAVHALHAGRGGGGSRFPPHPDVQRHVSAGKFDGPECGLWEASYRGPTWQRSTAYKLTSMWLQVLGALGLAGSAIISYGLALVVQVSPWYDPQVGFLAAVLQQQSCTACRSCRFVAC